MVEQCNDSGAAAGQEIRCTITVVNYLNANGTIAAAPASTVNFQICVGPAGAPICGAVTSSVSLVPVTTARQCNAALFGGGSTVNCTVTITNHWASSAGPTPATIFQCVGSPITGPGAPGTCTPSALLNTAASTPAATVGQCNGSGYGGLTPIGGFLCTVNASTTTALLPIHVDQCNGSGYGGGGTVICTATVTNDVVAAPPPPAPSPVPAQPAPVPVNPNANVDTPDATSDRTVVSVIVPVVPATGAAPVVVLVPVVPGVVPPAPAGAIVVAPVVIVPGVPQVVLAPIVVPPGVAQVIVPVVVPPGIVPRVVTQIAPRPAPTGNGGLTRERPSAASPWVVGLLALSAAGLTLGARTLVGARTRD